ncbi:MAG TPA: heavy metal translocating P-type ATPase metal-binding domain-containing protein [Chitinophagales bacterium]|nr:heavy metal translocating P-type ATPase metal-binding domain-containing protein [Chitinophagales bacterium]
MNPAMIFAPMAEVFQPTKILCYHCGDACADNSIREGDKIFCCEGCKLVNELLRENNLCTYYQLTEHPGQKPAEISGSNRFAWLDDDSASRELLSFSEGSTSVVNFSIPQIHCASCIWLLENLHRLEKGVIAARVNFSEKQMTIAFNNQQTSLRSLVEVLHRIGYEPEIHFNDLKKKQARKTDRALILKIGVAGFCFGNIMMLSFPEYLSGVSSIDPMLKHFFSYLNLVLAMPVFFYSAQDYFVNSWKAARQKYFSIDLPIALGLTAMLLRSSYEILTHTGAGFFDSMTGLVFFLLIGRYFQSLTYKNMSFERDYQSYFPVSVLVRKKGEEISIPLSKLRTGDKIVIHSEELIPADALLLKGNAHIDYSFVTGESNPIYKKVGDLIYAGGKQKGATIELLVQKTVEQSYLTQLWNHESFSKRSPSDKKEKHTTLSSLADRISKYFTIVILLMALATAVYWFPKDVHRGILAFTAILIIACPCALAITVPFTFGSIIRLLGRKNFYLKNASVVEALAGADTIVFDKTGTVTQQETNRISFEGSMLTGYQYSLFRNLVEHSIHPLSKLIHNFIPSSKKYDVTGFHEEAGEGIEAFVDGVHVKLGAQSFILGKKLTGGDSFKFARVYASIEEHYLGYFQIHNTLRYGLKEELLTLEKRFDCYLLSGDQDGERKMMEEVFENKDHLLFHQSPKDKLDFISCLRAQKKNVMMIGDGLNDAGALQQSNVGIAVSDDIIQFSPACDAIMKGSEFHHLHRYLKFCRDGISIIWFTFSISLLYNLAGIYFAVQGTLSPITAAILMPLSSISVILITTLATRWKAMQLSP